MTVPLNLEAHGVLCPECGTSVHEVKETRKRDGLLHRRRECMNKHRFNTFELAVREHGDLALAAYALDRLIASEQARVDADRAAHPDDTYRGLMQLEDIELLKEARAFVGLAGLPEAGPTEDSDGVQEDRNG